MREGFSDMLRRMAQEFDDTILKKVENVEPMTLREAEFILIPVVGQSLCIEVSKWANENRIKWRVWDGHTHYEAKTLAGAVDKCLEAYRIKAEPDPVDPIGEMQTAVDSVMVAKF